MSDYCPAIALRKRQRTGAVQKLAPTRTGHNLAKRLGLRQSPGALAGAVAAEEGAPTRVRLATASRRGTGCAGRAGPAGAAAGGNARGVVAGCAARGAGRVGACRGDRGIATAVAPAAIEPTTATAPAFPAAVASSERSPERAEPRSSARRPSAISAAARRRARTSSVSTADSLVSSRVAISR